MPQVPYDLNSAAPPTERTLKLGEELTGVMSADAFAILLSLVNWGTCWQDLHDGNTSMDNDKMKALMMVFRGVGVNPMSWQAYAGALVPIICNEVEKWTADEAYRTVSTMPWLMLRECAPALAQVSKGEVWNRKARAIIAKHFVAGARPDVPSLSMMDDKVQELTEQRDRIDNALTPAQQPIVPPRQH